MSMSMAPVRPQVRACEAILAVDAPEDHSLQGVSTVGPAPKLPGMAAGMVSTPVHGLTAPSSRNLHHVRFIVHQDTDSPVTGARTWLILAHSSLLHHTNEPTGDLMLIRILQGLIKHRYRQARQAAHLLCSCKGPCLLSLPSEAIALLAALCPAACISSLAADISSSAGHSMPRLPDAAALLRVRAWSWVSAPEPCEDLMAPAPGARACPGVPASRGSCLPGPRALRVRSV